MLAMTTTGEPGAPLTEDPPKIAHLRTFLNRPTRITIADGRIFQGLFMCIDNSKNIILSNTYEISPPNRHARRRNDSSSGNEDDQTSNTVPDGSINTPISTSTSTTSPGSMEGEKRYVGLVMVPGPHIVKAHVDTSHSRSGSTGGVPSSTAPSAGWKYDVDYLMG